MRNAVLIGIAAAAIASAGCGRTRSEDGGPVVQRSYQVGDFDQVEVAGPFDVTIRTGSAASVDVRGNEKLIEQLEVEVRGRTLEVHPRKRGFFSWGWGSHSGKGEIAITVQNLTAATLAGSGGISIDKVRGERFEGQIAGSGDLRIDSVDVRMLKLGIAGSGSASAGSGKASRAEYEIAGAGDVATTGVASENVKVAIAGSGDVKAQATGTADVDIMGSGDVDITGGAKCSVNKAGSGDVRCS